MTIVHVEAQATVHGLKYGQRSHLTLTPQVQTLIDRQLLAVVVDKDADKSSGSPDSDPSSDAGDQTAADDGGAGGDEGSGDDAEPAPKRQRRTTKETAAPKDD